MSFIATMGIGLLGFLAGNLLFIGVARWLATIYDILKDPTSAGRSGKGGRIALATLLGSGPWLIALAIGSAYAVRAEPWAIPLCIGAAIAVVFFSSVSVFVLRKARRVGR